MKILVDCGIMTIVIDPVAVRGGHFSQGGVLCCGG